MSGPKSIQGRLIVALTGAAIALSLATGAALYRTTRLDLRRGFDRALEAQASAVSSFVNVKPDGSLDFDYNDATMVEFRLGPHAQYFVIRFADGRIYARSSSLAKTSWIPAAPIAGEGHDLLLPNGREGRALRLDFVPSFDAEEHHGGKPPPPAAPMSITVARDRASLDGALNHFLRRLVLSGTIFALATALAVVLIVRRSLRPLREVARCAGEIGPAELHRRLPESGLPAELRPISARVNELLARLDQAFARERRFTSDVAHELRTPIAELRSVTEVALRWPDDQGSAIDALKESHDIAQQMQALVSTLLALVRSEHRPEVRLAPVSLRRAIEQSIREISAASALGIAQRGEADVAGTSSTPTARQTGRPEMIVEVPPDATVSAEPALLASVLRNVFSNALEYGDPSVPVRCIAQFQQQRWLLWVQNGAPNLAGGDLDRLFDPFWRKDAARSDSLHAGLGLSLVRAYCGLMSASVAAALLPGEKLRIELSLVACMPADMQTSAPRAAMARSKVS